ncbi:hypothetical protein MGN70_005849 [Eutypa lata]|nr:hypothetical protein MGN70_005849 [Eutypa lata]
MPTPIPNRTMMGKWTLGDTLSANGQLTNIGLVGTPLRSVLLNFGTSRNIQAIGSLEHKPGTVSYLAPKLELKTYGYSVNI